MTKKERLELAHHIWQVINMLRRNHFAETGAPLHDLATEPANAGLGALYSAVQRLDEIAARLATA